jgi:hypothetical protein
MAISALTVEHRRNTLQNDEVQKKVLETLRSGFVKVDVGGDDLPDSSAEKRKEFQTRGTAHVQNSFSETSIVSVTMRKCQNWCSCTCHIRRRFKTPSTLHAVFGTLFIGYTGRPTGGQGCTETTCAAFDQSLPFKAEFKYFFPSWLLAKAFIASFSSVFSQPTLCLSLRNTIPLNSPLFISSQKGRVDELQSLFSRGLARPNDIGGLYGDTALHVSTALLISRPRSLSSFRTR